MNCGICLKVTSFVRSDWKGFFIVLDVRRTYRNAGKQLPISHRHPFSLFLLSYG